MKLSLILFTAFALVGCQDVPPREEYETAEEVNLAVDAAEIVNGATAVSYFVQLVHQSGYWKGTDIWGRGWTINEASVVYVRSTSCKAIERGVEEGTNED